MPCGAVPIGPSGAHRAAAYPGDGIGFTGVDPMPNLNPPDRRPNFQQELLAIREDPEVRKLARRRAGNPDLAEDALQETYCAVAGVANPAVIRDLRAYFCQALVHEVYRLSGRLRATLVEDPTILADVLQEKVGDSSVAPRPVFETVCTNLLGEKSLKFLASQRARLTAEVPGRSPDPGRYRTIIVSVAEQVIPMIIIGDVSNADHNAALRIAYPEWFAEPGCSEETYHQRFSRARADVRALLGKVMSRDDLRPLAGSWPRYFRSPESARRRLAIPQPRYAELSQPPIAVGGLASRCPGIARGSVEAGELAFKVLVRTDISGSVSNRGILTAPAITLGVTSSQ